MSSNSNKKSSRKAKVLPQFSIYSGNKPLLDLLEIQRKSFFDLLERGLSHELTKTGIFRESAKNSSHVQQLELVFNPETYKLVSPNCTPKQAILKGKTYACKLYVQATLTIRSSPREIKSNFRSGDASSIRETLPSFTQKSLSSFTGSYKRNSFIDPSEVTASQSFLVRNREVSPFGKRKKDDFLQNVPIDLLDEYLLSLESTEKRKTNTEQTSQQYIDMKPPSKIASSKNSSILSSFPLAQQIQEITPRHKFTKKNSLDFITSSIQSKEEKSSVPKVQIKNSLLSPKRLNKIPQNEFIFLPYFASHKKPSVKANGDFPVQSQVDNPRLQQEVQRLNKIDSFDSLSLRSKKKLSKYDAFSKLSVYPNKIKNKSSNYCSTLKKHNKKKLQWKIIRKNLNAHFIREHLDVLVDKFSLIDSYSSPTFFETPFLSRPVRASLSPCMLCPSDTKESARVCGACFASKEDAPGKDKARKASTTCNNISRILSFTSFSFPRETREKSTGHEKRLLPENFINCSIKQMYSRKIPDFSSCLALKRELPSFNSLETSQTIPKNSELIKSPIVSPLKRNFLRQARDFLSPITFMGDKWRRSKLNNSIFFFVIDCNLPNNRIQRKSLPLFTPSAFLIENKPCRYDFFNDNTISKRFNNDRFSIVNAFSFPVMQGVTAKQNVENQQQEKDTEQDKNVQSFHPWIFLGELPLMTKRGHFILNGSPRVIVNQIARCPGIYFQEKRRGVGFEQEVRVSADLIPQRGPWLRIQSDWEGRFWARLKQEGRVKYTTLYEAFQESEKQYRAPIVNLVTNSSSLFPKSEVVAFQERKSKEDRQKKALVRLFKNSTRYSLGDVGRLRINQRIHSNTLSESILLRSSILKRKQFASVQPNFHFIEKDFLPIKGNINEGSASFCTGQGTQSIMCPVRAELAKDKVSNKRKENENSFRSENFSYPNDQPVKREKWGTEMNELLGCFTSLSPKEKAKHQQQEKDLLFWMRSKEDAHDLEMNPMNVLKSGFSYHSEFEEKNVLTDKARLIRFRDYPGASPITSRTRKLLDYVTTGSSKAYSAALQTKTGLTSHLLMAKDVDAIHTCLERLLEGQGFTDDIDHLKNRLVRTAGKLLQQQFELGLHRLNDVMTPLLKNLIQGQLLSSLPAFENVTTPKDVSIMRKGRKLTKFSEKPSPLPLSQEIAFSIKRNSWFRGGEVEPASVAKQGTQKGKKINSSSSFTESDKISSDSLSFFPYGHPKQSTTKQAGKRALHLFEGSREKHKHLSPFEKRETTNQKQKLLKSNSDQITKIGLVPPFRWLRTSKPVNSAFREFFGSNPLSQYMDQTNPLAEITHKRRLSSMGPGGIKRETAGMEVRGIHPTHYGRVCPIETPEGKNAGLVNSPTVYGRIGKGGFMETPLYQVMGNQVQMKRWMFFSAQQEEDEESSLATCDTGLMRFNLLAHIPIPVQTANNPLAHFQQVERNRVGYRALSPVQTISIATALIPFLEHDDANRALMGSNMQRQAIPLLSPERPIVGTGFEPVVIVESGQALQATHIGCVSHVSASLIVLHSTHFVEGAIPQNVLRNDSDFGLWDSSKKTSFFPRFGGASSLLHTQTLEKTEVKHPKHTRAVEKLNPFFFASSFVSDGQRTHTKQSTRIKMTRLLFNPTLCTFAPKAHRTNQSQAPQSWNDKTTKISINKKAIDFGLTFTELGISNLVGNRKDKNEVLNILKQTVTKSHLSPSHSSFLLKPIEQTLQIYQRSNQETCINQRPLVQEGDWIQKGDFLADCSASHLGDLALGKNVRVAYMPWEGYNFEDAIVISDRLVADDIYTSIHIERYEIKVTKNSQGKERITNQIPSLPSRLLNHLDNSGIARVSTWVQPGDILVGKVVELKRPLSPYERLAWELASRLSPTSPEKEKWLNKVWLEDISLRLPPGVCGRVINSQIVSTEWSEKDQVAYPLEVHIYLAVKRKIQVGDKLAGRHGNKGIVSIVLPHQDMPYLGDGTSIDMVLNPLGVPSRMNLGQIFECLLGLAGSQLSCNFKVTPFDEIAGGEASRSLVFLKMYQCRLMYKQQWLFTPTFPGKSKLFDGRTGEPFENWITVGQAYMLKLIHMVDHKIHARSTGPYSLFTRQPVRGRSRRGGQRLGEMEVWAVEGFGAAYTLQEFLTIKSDDLKARAALQRGFYKQNDITLGQVNIAPGNPEAFKVLISELQALCLHIQM